MAGNSRKQTVRFQHFHFTICQKWQATEGIKQFDFEIFIIETAKNFLKTFNMKYKIYNILSLSFRFLLGQLNIKILE